MRKAVKFDKMNTRSRQSGNWGVQDSTRVY